MNAHAAKPEMFPALVLNADFRPLSYYPLSLWSWQEFGEGCLLDRVNIVSEYDRYVRSPSSRSSFRASSPSRPTSNQRFIPPSRDSTYSCATASVANTAAPATTSRSII